VVGLLALGCVSGSNTYYPLQKRPVVPSVAIGDPDVWVKCSSYGSPPEAIVSRMYCVELVHVEELRRYIIEMADCGAPGRSDWEIATRAGQCHHNIVKSPGARGGGFRGPEEGLRESKLRHRRGTSGSGYFKNRSYIS